jgi:type VI secretion system secreted protein Hcp
MTLMGIIRITLAAFVFVAFGTVTAQADSIYISIKGQKQGPFKGEALQKGFEGKIAGLKFRYELVSPRDIATGMATGRRQNKPVMITKEWGAASPQLFQALVTNEVLPEVVIDFVVADPKNPGMVLLSHSIKLTTALVTDISQSTEPIATGGVRLLEDVTFVFGAIELIDVRSNTMSRDTWIAPVQ